jgi:hypothetical protein
VCAGKLEIRVAENLRRLKPPGEDSMSSQEESDGEGIEEQEKDVEGIEDIEADKNLRITKGLMVDCNPKRKHFLRHMKEKLTVGPKTFIHVLDDKHLFVLHDLLDQPKSKIEVKMGEG